MRNMRVDEVRPLTSHVPRVRPGGPNSAAPKSFDYGSVWRQNGRRPERSRPFQVLLVVYFRVSGHVHRCAAWLAY